MKKHLVLLLLLVITFFDDSSVLAQIASPTSDYYLTLNKPGKTKRIRFYKGDDFKFKLNYEKHWREAILTNIDSTGITINDAVRIPLDNISKVLVRKESYWGSMAKGASAAGIGTGVLFLAGGGVAAIFGNETYTRSGVQVGGALLTLGLTSGLISYLTTRRAYKMNKYRFLRSIPSSGHVQIR